MRDGRAEPGGREASLHRISTDRAASPSPWPCRTGGQACHSGVPAVGVEAFMNNAGYNPLAIQPSCQLPYRVTSWVEARLTIWS